VARRYIFDSPEPYSYEVSTILLIWCFVLSVAALQWQERHIRGDFVLSRLPKNAQYFIDHLLAPLLGLLCGVLLCWKGIPSAMFSLSIHEVSSSVWKEPIFPVKIMIPIGFGMLCLVLVYQVYKGFAGWPASIRANRKASGPGLAAKPPESSSVEEGTHGS
jgi:TRAP-type mannitol/chloroaromatic compound transport system permease small subunit